MTLETARLRLVPFAPQHILALLESERAFEELFGLPPAPGLRDSYTSAEVSPVWLAQLRASTEPSIWKHGYAIVDPEAKAVIGGIGFKAPPDADGMVEIAYGLCSEFQNRGYATEASRAVIDFAFKTGEIRVIRAHTLPVNNASKGVLTKTGFQFLSEVIEPEDGLVWRWERRAD